VVFIAMLPPYCSVGEYWAEIRAKQRAQSTVDRVDKTITNKLGREPKPVPGLGAELS
jgi:hypothetical protein